MIDENGKTSGLTIEERNCVLLLEGRSVGAIHIERHVGGKFLISLAGRDPSGIMRIDSVLVPLQRLLELPELDFSEGDEPA